MLCYLSYMKKQYPAHSKLDHIRAQIKLAVVLILLLHTRCHTKNFCNGPRKTRVWAFVDSFPSIFIRCVFHFYYLLSDKILIVIAR